MAFLGNDGAMSDVQDVIQQIEQKTAALTKVAEARNEIIEKHTQTPLKIIVAATMWGWLIYRVLIKR